MLSDRDLLLYSRQIMLQEIGPRGQEKLKQGRVAVVGLGGLGSSAAFYLAAAGVGKLKLIDHDQVSLSNLQRQILHRHKDVGADKTISAADSLRALDPELELCLHSRFFNSENGADLLKNTDFVVDGSDNAETKFLIAAICHQEKVPYSHAGVSGFGGQTMTVVPGSSACCRCLFRRPLETISDTTNCDAAGIVGAVAGIIGSLQALEAIKFITGAGRLLTDRLFIFNGIEGNARNINLRRDPHCPLCGTVPDTSVLINS